MKKSQVSLQNGRVSFPNDLETNPNPLRTVAGLRFEVAFSGGRAVTVDLTGYPLRPIAAAAATILWEETQPGGTLRSPGSTRQIINSLRRLAEFLATYSQTRLVRSLRDLTATDIDAFEDYLRVRYGTDSMVTWNLLRALRHFLELSLTYGYVNESIKPRLAYVSRGGKGKNTPRDAYSPFIATQLRDGAKKDIEAAIERITVTGVAFIGQGRNPVEHGWKVVPNIAWHLAHQGYLGASDSRIKSVLNQSPVKYSTLISYVHPTVDDVMAFIVALSLSSGLPIECIRELKMDCLQNERKGYANLRYVKRRRGQKIEASLPVRSDTPFSPGWLVRAALRLTQITRKQVTLEDRDKLFIGYNRKEHLGCISKITTSTNKNDPTVRFTQRHRILDDSGKPLNGFQQYRLRKTFKAEQYVKVNGHLADAASEHSKSVHARHYADIPSLRPLHEAAIAAGIQAAMDAAFMPIILDAAGEAKLKTAPLELAAELNRDGEQVAGVADGSRDVWLAGCLDYENSPHGSKGETCPYPVWGCLECSNAVITSAKLPAILAFLNHILSKRHQMSLSAWSVRFERAHRRITEQVLPRFPVQEITLAKAVAEAEGHLVWLPAELTMAP